MVKHIKENKAIWLTVAFLVVNVALLTQEVLWGWALPAVLAIALIAIYKYDWLIAFCVFATPLSFNFEELDLGGVGFFFPTEPIFFGLLILALMQTIVRSPVSASFAKHHVSLVILFGLFWMGVCTYASTMPIVSLKYFIARLWFVVVLFFLTGQIFKQHKKIEVFLWLYMGPLCLVVLHSIYNLSTDSFTDMAAHWASQPFFKDHTSYGAVLAMYIPAAIILALRPSRSILIKALKITVAVILFAGVIFSYTRAAWVSLVGALGVYVILKLKIKFSVVATGIVMVLGLYFIYQDQILESLEKNEKESSEELVDHVESISNISSDASNLERINRWNSALRMFYKKPIFGFGPGTYMFQYAPFQRADEKTIISTNFGEVGNAHSEYLGPLSEGGFMGMLSFVALLIVILRLGLNLYYRLDPGVTRDIVMALLLGLITYFIHGVLNNYLDTDKASVPFWTFIAALVAIDLWHSKNNKEEETAG
ncbi:O-antigen ligase family protein [Luteibaculum oceani]|uniref:O-antigen ligase-related domain-containing protein n=1 Tax=Luteibaculum oceani TaxID=1294296 RepID=A0A5C6V151_9FLAO|nr:O-antigen ligase family protein [Luteibaculum oceani]TXC78361.1 hypothetical protein FRX97_08505 [Luteibaculum oceani]